MTVAMCLCLMVLTTNAQTLKDLFNKYADDERFEYVSVGKGMLSIARIFGETEGGEADVLSRINGIKILTLTDGFDDTLQKDVLKEVDGATTAGQFETLVEVREKEEKVYVYSRNAENGITDMLVVTQDEAELSLIWIKGNLTQEELMGLLAQ